MWEIERSSDAVRYKPKYFFYLPVKQEVIYTDYLDGLPSRHYGSLDSFMAVYYGCPIIPVDFHLAFSLGWLTEKEFIDNAAYLSDTVKAAIKLVT
jgi:hypothetical protein